MERVAISRVTELPAHLDSLVRAAMRESFPALDRLRDEYSAGTNRFEAPGEALFVARQDGRLVGICGLNRDPFLEDTKTGRLRRLYVLPQFRREGIGRGLVDAVRHAADKSFQRLRLRTHDPVADAFYRALGFKPVADDPFATHVIALG